MDTLVPVDCIRSGEHVTVGDRRYLFKRVHPQGHRWRIIDRHTKKIVWISDRSEFSSLREARGMLTERLAGKR